MNIAEKIAPYRHHRLAGLKLNRDPVDPGLKADASLEELQPEMVTHFEILAPVLDFKALAALSDGVANREVPQRGTGNDDGGPRE